MRRIFFGRATLFNKHTFEQDVEVKAIHIPTDKAYCSGWSFEAVVPERDFDEFPKMACHDSC